MNVIAFVFLLAQAPAAPSPTAVPSLAPPPQLPTTQQTMRTFQQFRPELTESRRQLMAAITQSLTPQQLDEIAADIGTDAVADKPNVTVLTSEIDGVLTPPARAAIAAAFVRYAARQQALSKQIQAEMPTQPVAFVPADAARLLAHRPIGAGILRPAHATQPLLPAPIVQLRQTMRARMLTALTPAHRTAVGELYGKTAISASDAGQPLGAQIDALLAPSERQAILSAHAQFVAEAVNQIDALKALALQQAQAMSAEAPPAFLNAVKRRIDALGAPPAAPVDAGAALVSALMLPAP